MDELDVYLGDLNSISSFRARSNTWPLNRPDNLPASYAAIDETPPELNLEDDELFETSDNCSTSDLIAHDPALDAILNGQNLLDTNSIIIASNVNSPEGQHHRHHQDNNNRIGHSPQHHEDQQQQSMRYLPHQQQTLNQQLDLHSSFQHHHLGAVCSQPHQNANSSQLTPELYHTNFTTASQNLAAGQQLDTVHLEGDYASKGSENLYDCKEHKVNLQMLHHNSGQGLDDTVTLAALRDVSLPTHSHHPFNDCEDTSTANHVVKQESNLDVKLSNVSNSKSDVSASTGKTEPPSGTAAAVTTVSAATNKKQNTPRRNAWGNMSYADLISQAINSTDDKRLTLSQIYDWMVQNVPYFKDKGDSNSSAGWKNSIRHNLSLHNRFKRMQNEGTGKSSWWVINPDAKFGKCARRRAASMETSKFEKKRGRAKKKAEEIRKGLIPYPLLSGPLDHLSSPSSSLGEGLDTFPEPHMTSGSSLPAPHQRFHIDGEFRQRAASNASSCRLSPLPVLDPLDVHDNQAPPMSPNSNWYSESVSRKPSCPAGIDHCSDQLSEMASTHMILTTKPTNEQTLVNGSVEQQQQQQQQHHHHYVSYSPHPFEIDNELSQQQQMSAQQQQYLVRNLGPREFVSNNNNPDSFQQPYVNWW